MVELKLASDFDKKDEKECSYYVKTELCKFGETCKFHHPQPDSIQLSTPGPAAHTIPIITFIIYILILQITIS